MNHDEVQKELLARALAGDGRALGELLDAHRDYLRVLADRELDSRLAARLDASDVVQQTCLSVHKQIGGFAGEDPAQFVAWLRKIHERNIQNAIRDQLQTDKRAAGRDEPLQGQPLAARSEFTASQRAVRNEEKQRLAAAIEQLPPDERTALRLRYLQGMTLAETAEQLHITRDALLWLLKRALNRIRTFLPGDE